MHRDPVTIAARMSPAAGSQLGPLSGVSVIFILPERRRLNGGAFINSTALSLMYSIAYDYINGSAPRNTIGISL